MRKTIETQPIRIHLSVGDARSYPADVSVIGSGPSLLREVERATGMRFERLVYPDHILRKHGPLDGLKRTRILRCDDFVWKNTISLGARPSRRVRTAFLSEWVEAMHVVVRRSVRPDSLLIVPHQRDPEDVVAKTTLFFVWCVHRLSIGGTGFHRPRTTRIVDVEDVSPFLELIGPRNDELRHFFGTQLERFLWTDPEMVSAAFEIV